MEKHMIPMGGKPALRTGRRTAALILFFAVALSYLGIRIFCLQVFGYESAQRDVMDEITVSSRLRAKRGDILDANGNILATSRTVYRIYISPRGIARKTKENGREYATEIADGLSSLLGISRETILKKTQKTRYLDETVARNVNADLTQRVLQFIEEKGLDGLILTEASEARYYPSGGMAAHLIGFTGSDNQGLFGLEYFYDDDLSGEDGAYLSAVDAHGNDQSYGYTTYKEATDGLTLITTLDSFIQRELESCLAEIIEEFDVRDRATGIVMNVNTGAILAMATAPTFDLNAPYTLDSISEGTLEAMGFTEGSDAYRDAKNSLLLEMWQNKAISELYEPGSTFKIVTSAMAIDLGVTSATDASFFCGGSYSPAKGVNISCWRKIGHGRGFTYGYGLQQSCNCALMQVASRIGSESFYSYFKAFGLLERTGIDLPSEANSIFHSAAGLGTVELATSSFGQRFKVTPLQELTAIAAVANGGYLVTPHLIDSLRDSEGHTVYKHETEVKRQAVSTAAADSVCAILEEGVSGTGASRNAYAAGYRIAAKTGTSEKLDKQDANGGYSLRIGSCVAFAPFDESEIAVIIVVDEPTTAHFGATVAAPYISRLVGRVLPYLGYSPVYKSGEEAMQEIPVGRYVGMTVKEAKKALAELGLTADTGGAADTARITAQFPTAGGMLSALNGRVFLYTEEAVQTLTTVPNIIGMDMQAATRTLLNAGLNIRLAGAQTAPPGVAYPKAASQSLSAGLAVPRGTPVTVTFLYDDKE